MSDMVLKDYYYTDKAAAFHENVKKWKNGEKEYTNIQEALEDSGYSPSTSKTYAHGAAGRNIVKIIEKEFPSTERIQDIVSIIKEARKLGKYTPALKAHDMLARMSGDYAADHKSEVSMKLQADIQVEHNIGEFKDFLNAKRKERIDNIKNDDTQYIDGEVIEKIEEE